MIDALAFTLPERLTANAALPDVADFLRLRFAGRHDECLSYHALLCEAGRFANHYHACGLQPGERIAVILKHSRALYTSFVGALLGGFVPSIWPFPSPKISRTEYAKMLSALLDNAEPGLVITYPELREEIQKSDGLSRHKALVTTAEDVPDHCGTPPTCDAIDPDAIAFLQYSSGTTGTKKGVAISHRALLWQVDRYAEAIGLCDDDRIVSWLPLYHDMGLIACLLLPVTTRTPLVAMCPFEWVQQPATWLRAVSETRATLSWLPNFAYNFMVRSVSDAELVGVDLASLRGVVNCSEPIMAESHARFLRRFESVGLRASALCASYAMAENTFAVTSGGFEAPLRHDCINADEFAKTGRAVPADASDDSTRTLVSSGTALPGTEIRIADEDGNTLPDRQLGEIVLRSPCQLSAYHRNDDATRAAVRDGELFTRDVGYLADGELYVTGRKKDMLIIRGQNVYPQDIETLVSEVPGVIPGRCAAVGIANEQEGTEDLVVLAESAEADTPRRNEIRRRIARRISEATDVTPADVRVLPHMWLRKSTSGKISRRINRERYVELTEREQQQGSTPSVTLAADNGSVARYAVRRCVRRAISQKRMGQALSFQDDEPLIKNGLIDSLELVSLLQAIEADCGVSISSRALAATGSVITVQSLAELVDRIRSGGVGGADTGGIPRRREDVALVLSQPRTPRPAMRFWSGVSFWSRYYRWVLRRRGVRVGRDLRVEGPLILRLDGDPRNVTIGDHVTLMPGVDLKIRENGTIVLHDGVVLDTNVRLVAANDARIELGQDVQIGIGTVINAGQDVIIGRRTAVAGYCTIVASEHNYLSKTPFMQQGYQHDPVFIGEDVWVAANVFIGRGSRIGGGAVLGVKSVVRGDVPAYAIVMGNPARVVRFRG